MDINEPKGEIGPDYIGGENKEVHYGMHCDGNPSPSSHPGESTKNSTIDDEENFVLNDILDVENEREIVCHAESCVMKPSPCAELASNMLTPIKDDKENVTSQVNSHSAEHLSRSRHRGKKSVEPVRTETFTDQLPPLESEGQFLAAIKNCARGGESLERENGRVVLEGKPLVLSPITLQIEPIISSSPGIKERFKEKNIKHQRTAAEIDAFFTRLSTPKYIKGAIVNKNSVCSHLRKTKCEATKKHQANVVHTRGSCFAESKNPNKAVGK